MVQHRSKQYSENWKRRVTLDSSHSTNWRMYFNPHSIQNRQPITPKKLSFLCSKLNHNWSKHAKILSQKLLPKMSLVPGYTVVSESARYGIDGAPYCSHPWGAHNRRSFEYCIEEASFPRVNVPNTRWSCYLCRFWSGWYEIQWLLSIRNCDHERSIDWSQRMRRDSFPINPDITSSFGQNETISEFTIINLHLTLLLSFRSPSCSNSYFV